jgi:hypothetical protein
MTHNRVKKTQSKSPNMSTQSNEPDDIAFSGAENLQLGFPIQNPADCISEEPAVDPGVLRMIANASQPQTGYFLACVENIQ